MIAATHWQRGNPTGVDGAEFHVKDGGELGHIHLDGEVHIALTSTLRDQLVDQRLAQPLVWDKAWVTAPVTSPSEADQAIWLLRLAYDRLCATPAEVLARRIQERSGPPSARGQS